MEPQPKRPRSEFDGLRPTPRFPDQLQPPPRLPQRPQDWSVYQQGSGRHVSNPSDSRDVGQQPVSSAGKPKPCMKFFSTSGCPFGECCHFLHYMPGGLSSFGLSPVISPSVVSSSASQKKGPGPAGDPSVMVNGYKTKLCNRFNTPEGCRFGDRCHFAHGENDLRRPNNISRVYRPPAVSGPSGTAPGFSNASNFSKPPGNASNFIPHEYVEPNQLGVAGNNAGPVNRPVGAISENVPVY